MKNIGKLLCSVLVVTFLLLLPDAIFGFINPNLAVCANTDKIGVMALLALCLTFVSNKKVLIAFTAFFGLLQMTQFSSMAYFGVYLTPYAIDFIFLEAGDVATEIKDVWFKYLYVIPLVAVPYCVMAWLLCRDKLFRFRVKYGWVFLLLFFGMFFYKAQTPRGAFQMMFKQTCFASYNTVNSYAVYFANILPEKIFGKKAEKEYPAYKLTNVGQNGKEPVNIVFVVGESINVNHFSLFGYHRPTTPKLEAFAKAHPDFVYKKAWAAAVNTMISLPMIYNIQVNPKNYRKLIKRDSYLFKMAHENGFKVTYIEGQNESLLKKTSVSDTDAVFVYNEKDSAAKGEIGFLKDVFSKIDLNDGRNLVLVHRRNIHSPYKNNTMFESEKYGVFTDRETDSRINDYDNAVLYEDDVMTEILKFAQSSERKTYFFFVSDHGEALGQNGIWGHGHLDAADLEVPFMYAVFNGTDAALSEKIAAKPVLCSHDVSLAVAEALGWSVEIPGEDLTVCQVNGRDSMGRAGVLKITPRADGTADFKLEK